MSRWALALAAGIAVVTTASALVAKPMPPIVQRAAERDAVVVADVLRVTPSEPDPEGHVLVEVQVRIDTVLAGNALAADALVPVHLVTGADAVDASSDAVLLDASLPAVPEVGERYVLFVDVHPETGWQLAGNRADRIVRATDEAIEIVRRQLEHIAAGDYD